MTTKKEQERLPQSMKAQEYACIHDLLMQYRPKDTLEVGMAHAGSTLVFCKYAKHNWGRRHVAIDPFQSSTTGSSGLGLRRINEAGYSEYLEFHEDFDYLVLPELVKTPKGTAEFTQRVQPVLDQYLKVFGATEYAAAVTDGVEGYKMAAGRSR